MNRIRKKGGRLRVRTAKADYTSRAVRFRKEGGLTDLARNTWWKSTEIKKGGEGLTANGQQKVNAIPVSLKLGRIPSVS